MRRAFTIAAILYGISTLQVSQAAEMPLACDSDQGAFSVRLNEETNTATVRGDLGRDPWPMFAPVKSYGYDELNHPIGRAAVNDVFRWRGPFLGDGRAPRLHAII